MRVTESDIRWAASQLATDTELCTIYGLEAKDLERWRPLIDSVRTKAMLHLKMKRAEAQAKKAAKA